MRNYFLKNKIFSNKKIFSSPPFLFFLLCSPHFYKKIEMENTSKIMTHLPLKQTKRWSHLKRRNLN